MSRFVHLAVHSHYSLMRGTASPEELGAAAVRRGMDTLALTDTDGVYGLVRFWEVAKAATRAPSASSRPTPAMPTSAGS